MKNQEVGSAKPEAGRNSRGKSRLVLGVVLLAAVFAGCKARKQYPDLTPGWHDAGYTKVFGRIQRVAQADPEAKPVWIVRYDYTASDTYGGRLNLYPDGAMAGYSGGELVELRGAIAPGYSLPNFSGTWFKVDEIRMWSNHNAQ